MIALESVTKRYATRTGTVTVLQDVNLAVARGERVGILGRNGSGKSTLIRLIGGVEPPSEGRVRRMMTVSWPLAFGGAFQPSLTGLDNLKFVCRVYGVDAAKAIAFVEEFAELGRFFREPLRVYSSGMRARLAFALSMAVEFDCFMIDEVIAVGDSRFHEKCRAELFEKRRDRALVMVSHEPHVIREHCDRACVLHQGLLHRFDTVEAAYDFYLENTPKPVEVPA